MQWEHAAHKALIRWHSQLAGRQGGLRAWGREDHFVSVKGILEAAEGC